jgi:oligoendopeptidase F
VPQYFELLAAGGSDTPSALVKRMGLDLDDPDFWSAGLDVVESLLVTAETLAGG